MHSISDWIGAASRPESREAASGEQESGFDPSESTPLSASALLESRFNEATELRYARGVCGVRPVEIADSEEVDGSRAGADDVTINCGDCCGGRTLKPARGMLLPKKSCFRPIADCSEDINNRGSIDASGGSLCSRSNGMNCGQMKVDGAE